MLESVLADVMQQLLQLRDLHHAYTAERIKGSTGERAFAYVSANHPGCVVGGEARKAHRPRFYAAHDCAERILLADRSGDDLLEVHAHVLEKMLGQVAAMEAHGLVRIVA